MKTLIAVTTFAFGFGVLLGSASAKDPKLAGCREQCAVGRDTCKEGCQVERPTGWGSESQRYADCDGDCKSDYENCMIECKQGEDE